MFRKIKIKLKSLKMIRFFYSFLKAPLISIKLILIYLKSKIYSKKLIYFRFTVPTHISFCEELLIELKKDINYKIIIIFNKKKEFYKKNLDIENLEKDYDVIYAKNYFLGGLLCDALIDPLNTSPEVIKGKKIHMPHSMVSLASVYGDSCHKNYDFIFSQGPENYKEFDELVKKNNLATKILKTGYNKVDFLYKKKMKTNSFNKFDKKIILIAPSWGAGRDESPFCDMGYEVVRNLIENYIIVYRPHPCSVTVKEKAYLNIMAKFSKHPNFIYDKSKDGFEYMRKSLLMITDWSGVGFEYYLAFNKPIIYLDGVQKRNISNSIKCKVKDLIEYKYRSEIGKIIDNKELSELKKIVDLEINEFDKKKIDLLRKKLLYNFNESGINQKRELDKILK